MIHPIGVLGEMTCDARWKWWLRRSIFLRQCSQSRQCSELILAYNLVSCQSMMSSQCSTVTHPTPPSPFLTDFYVILTLSSSSPPGLAQLDLMGLGLTGALLHRFRVIFNSNNSSHPDQRFNGQKHNQRGLIS